MILCFDCSDRTRDILDRLITEGLCRDYTEAIALAVSNLGVLQSRLGPGDAVFVEPTHGSVRAKRPPSAPADGTAKTRPDSGHDLAKGSSILRVPALFALHEVAKPPCTAPLPSGAFKQREHVPLERWVFGQFNRLLPAKASCRAMANLLLEDPEGLELDRAAPRIVEAAAELGASLVEHESRLEIHRDEALSTAFPTQQNRAQKSQLRFQTQFIAGATKAGDLTGLLADLKLVNYRAEPGKRIALTDAGWGFALARNPVLDEEPQLPVKKFNPDEQEFLLVHIGSEVPAEDSAYRAVLDAIDHGATSPGGLDEALAARVSEAAKGRISSSFVSTQRSGAVSRMSDLGLVARVRDGVRVTYVATPRGRSYHSSAATRSTHSVLSAGSQ